MAVYSIDFIRAQAQRAAAQHGARASNPYPSGHPAHEAFADELREALGLVAA